MKKHLFSILLVLLLAFLAACGSDSSDSSNGSESESENTETETTENTEEPAAEEPTEEAPEEESKEMTAEENENTEAAVGDTIKSEAGEMTLVSRTDDVGTFESGPIKLTVEKVNGVSGKLSQQMADMMEKEQLEYIQVDMTVENTSEENVTFYASQAVMTTSTGEQLDPDMLLSDHIDGEYIGPVTKSGSSFYILENSKAEDVESVRLIFSGAVNENFETIGEEIDIEVPLNK